MKQIKTLLIAIMAIVLISTGCFKTYTPQPPDNPYGLPNATKDGADIFAFRANGSSYIGQLTFGSGVAIRGGIQNDTLDASCEIFTSSIASDEILILGININKNLVQGNTYNLNDTSIADISCISDSICSGVPSSLLDLRAASGIVTLTKLDTIKKIISGTFNCNIPVPNCDTLFITDGRFDIQYY